MKELLLIKLLCIDRLEDWKNENKHRAHRVLSSWFSFISSFLLKSTMEGCKKEMKLASPRFLRALKETTSYPTVECNE